MRVGRRDAALVGVVTAAIGLAACNGGGDGDADGSSPVSDAPAATDPAPADAATTPTTSVASTERVTTVATSLPLIDAATTTIGTVPDDGVPGIESVDAFCRSWSEFAGSFQALALASAFAVDRTRPPRLEVAAAPVLVASVAGLDAHLPDELEPERVALTSDLAGPMLRRAERAVEELEVAGLTPAAIEELGELWLTALLAAGLDDPDITVDVAEDGSLAGFGAAATAFTAAVPPINEDPSLITDASIPLTERYLAENCPDRGTLAGNDVIDG